MYKLKKIEIITFNKNGARECTSSFTVPRAPYPLISDHEKSFRRNLRKYLDENHKTYSGQIFSTPKSKRVVKVITNRTVFYL